MEFVEAKNPLKKISRLHIFKHMHLSGMLNSESLS